MTPSPNPEATQDAARVTATEAWSIMSRMIAGMLLYGALGWLVGRLLEAPTAGLAVGVLVGLVLGLVLSVLRLRVMGTDAPTIAYSGSQSWSARLTRARVERPKEVAHGD